MIADPSPAYHGLQFHETFGTYGYLMKLRAETLRDLGGALSPFNAFLFLQGLETLSLRMERHVKNAQAVAEFLDSHELASNVTHALAAAAFFCFFFFSFSFFLFFFFFFFPPPPPAGHVVKSLIIHPASTTHRQLSDAELEVAGVRPGTTESLLESQPT